MTSMMQQPGMRRAHSETMLCPGMHSSGNGGQFTGSAAAAGANADMASHPHAHQPHTGDYLLPPGPRLSTGECGSVLVFPFVKGDKFRKEPSIFWLSHIAMCMQHVEPSAFNGLALHKS